MFLVVASWVLIWYLAKLLYLWATEEKTRIHYVCPCGYYEEPEDGRLNNVRFIYCPKCGVDRDNWYKEIRRWHRDHNWLLIDYGQWEVFFEVPVKERMDT